VYSNIQLLKKFSPAAGFPPINSLTPPGKNPAIAHGRDGRTYQSMSLFTAVLHASQSLCHELNVFIGLTNKYVLRKR